MPSIKLPHFGTLDSASLEEYYDANIEYNNTEIQIDLNFESKTIDITRLELVKHFIDNIRIHDLNNKKLIQQDFDDEDADTVRTYIEHHQEELASDDLEELTGSGTKSADLPPALLNRLHLVRVGLYPGNDEQFATFDYSIGTELTNHLVVLFTDQNGNLDYMTIES